MKHSDGLFLRVAREVAEERAASIGFDDRIVDAFCMNMVVDPPNSMWWCSPTCTVT